MNPSQETSPAEPFWATPKYTTVPVDAQIVADHAYIRHIHQQYKSANTTDQKLRFINEFIRTVAVHAVAEEIVVYPAMEARLVRGHDTRQHALHEHALVKKLLHGIDRMAMDHAQFDQLVDDCVKELEQHMVEEEETVLPQLRRNCWETELVQLNNQYVQMKGRVPTHPHPMAPDRPPFETVISMLQAPLDKLYDTVARVFPAKTSE